MTVQSESKPVETSTSKPVPLLAPLLLALAVALPFPALPVPAAAQEPTDSLRAELARLRARMDSLEAVLERLQAGEEAAEAEGELARLREAARQAAREGGREEPQEETEFQGRQRSLQALNPEISLNVDVFGHVNTDDANGQNFVPREFEFSFQSALDPFSRAKIFLTRENAGPETVPFVEEEEGEEEEGEVDVEEGYVEWVGLPGGVSVKLGKFFQRLGGLNRWHSHALPFQSRWLPHIAFVGEGPVSQAGASFNWLLPVEGVGSYDMTFEVTRSSNGALFGESSEASFLGHLNGFWQLSRSTDLDLSVSWMGGDFRNEALEIDRNLYTADFALTWMPPATSRRRSLVVRGGAMLLDGLLALSRDGEAEGDAFGVWSMAELRLARSWLVGGRFDWVENPEDPDETAWLVSPTLTWWQSEWVRVRLEYDLLGRSVLSDDEGRLWLQVTFAMGPHKHETY